MATTLASVGLGATVGWSYQNVVTLGNSLQNNQFRFAPTSFRDGSGAGQVNRLYAIKSTIAASGNVTHTLTNFTDFFGNTVSMLRFKLLYVGLPSSSSQATSIQVGNAAQPLANWISNSTVTINVRAGGCLLLVSPDDATGYAIVAGTSDQLKILNNDSSNTASYDLCIMGCNA